MFIFLYNRVEWLKKAIVWTDIRHRLNDRVSNKKNNGSCEWKNLKLSQVSTFSWLEAFEATSAIFSPSLPHFLFLIELSRYTYVIHGFLWDETNGRIHISKVTLFPLFRIKIRQLVSETIQKNEHPSIVDDFRWILYLNRKFDFKHCVISDSYIKFSYEWVCSSAQFEIQHMNCMKSLFISRLIAEIQC